MSDKPATRKIAFNLHPEEEAADRFAARLLDEVRVKERGRLMRAFLLTGAALAAVDRRLPYMIAELADEDVSLQSLQRLISSVIPGAFAPDESLLQALRARAENGEADRGESPATLTSGPSEQELAEQATRANSYQLFGDDDD